MDPGCLSVCVSVCVSVRALQPKWLGRFWWNFTQIISRTWVSVIFSKILDISIWWRHGGHFALFLCSTRHSHGRNFGLISFKFEHDVEFCQPVFAIENQQNQLIRSGFIKNRAYDFSRFSPKIAAKTKIVRYRQVRGRFRLTRTCWTRIW